MFKQTVLAGIAALALVAGQAQAKMAVEISGGYNTYAMGDANDLLNAATFGTTITNGFQGGAALKYGINPNILADVHVDYLTAGATGNNSAGTITLPVLSIGIGGAYIVPLSSGLDVRGNLGLSYDMLSGANFTGGGSTTTFAGSTPDILVGVGGDYGLNDAWSLGLTLGYRYAKISPVTATNSGNSSNLKTANGSSDAAIDYSGLAVKLGLDYWFM